MTTAPRCWRRWRSDATAFRRSRRGAGACRHRGRDLGRHRRRPGRWTSAPVAHAHRRLLPHQSDRAGQRDHGASAAGNSSPAHQDGGGIGMALIPFCRSGWSTGHWLGRCPMAGPGSSASAVMILIFDVVLLLSIAVVLLADRKIWAAVQMRRGPNVVGPFGLLQTFADAVQIPVQGSDHSGRRQQGDLPARAAGHRDPGLRRPGR